MYDSPGRRGPVQRYQGSYGIAIFKHQPRRLRTLAVPPTATQCGSPDRTLNHIVVYHYWRNSARITPVTGLIAEGGRGVWRFPGRPAPAARSTFGSGNAAMGPNREVRGGR